MTRSLVKWMSINGTADAYSGYYVTVRRPLVRTTNHQTLDRVKVIAKSNYTAYTYLGLHTQFMVRYLRVPDTGAGPNFVVESVLLPQLQAQIRSHAIPAISLANKNPLKTIGTIILVVRLGQLVVKVEFIVCESLAVPVILGCDRFFESIQTP